jgi:hypothetical protein
MSWMLKWMLVCMSKRIGSGDLVCYVYIVRVDLS